MTKAEKILAAKLLELAADEYACHGANGFKLKNTPENRAIVAEMYKWNDDEEFVREVYIDSARKIVVLDYELMRYLSTRLSMDAALEIFED